MRALGVDLGTRRIGVAVSDSGGRLALPRAVLERSGEPSRDHAALAALAEEVGAEVVVVGLPLRLDGGVGPAARAAQAEVAALGGVLARLGVAVETLDERLTTVTATRALAGAGRSGRARRRVVDQSAAAVLLQSWLDRQRPRSRASEAAT